MSRLRRATVGTDTVAEPSPRAAAPHQQPSSPRPDPGVAEQAAIGAPPSPHHQGERAGAATVPEVRAVGRVPTAAHHQSERAGAATVPDADGLLVVDALRGLAALYVAAGHAAWLLWAAHPLHVDPTAGPVDALATRFAASLNFGHQAVLLFFLISGFCVHYRQARQRATADTAPTSRPRDAARPPSLRRPLDLGRLARLVRPFLPPGRFSARRPFALPGRVSAWRSFDLVWRGSARRLVALPGRVSTTRSFVPVGPLAMARSSRSDLPVAARYPVDPVGPTATARSFDLAAYAGRRARRLYPPLLLALAVTALVDGLGRVIDPGFYAGQTQYESINANVGQASYGLTTLLANLVVQPDLLGPVFGTNTPLWSLGYELWFYALYPLALIAIGRLGPGRAFGLVALVSAAALALALAGRWWPTVVVGYWVVWMAGALVAEAHVGTIGSGWLRRTWPVALPALVLLALGHGTVTAASGAPAAIWGGAAPALLLANLDLLYDLVWSVPLALLFGGLVLSPEIAGRLARPARRLAPLARCSYSLYVLHFPWLALLSAAWLAANPRLPESPALALAGLLSSLGLAGLGWWLVERRWHPVGRVVSHDRRADGVCPTARAALGANDA